MDKTKNLQLSDPEFEQTLSLQQAYLTMLQFLSRYHLRGETTTSDLLSDIQVGLWADSGSADPAQLYDFLDAFEQVTQK
jgi:hypothetical protein